MALLDHFHPPLSERRHWHAFHNSWATYLSSQLNARLPQGYFAEANVQFGIEIDVAAFEEPSPRPSIENRLNWIASEPKFSAPVSWSPTVVEVGIFSRSGGPILAGAIELVSPANKDRPAHRDALISKCASYLQAGVGVVLVDVVTERVCDFHGELLERVGIPGTKSPTPLYASAYRTIERDEKSNLDIWYESLAIGQPLPTMPLWLRGGLCMPVELNETYERTCTEQRLNVAA